MGMRRVAALYVDGNGIYSRMPDVDVWDEARDARLYDGDDPVVAHPPCQTWGAFARSRMTKRPLGDDDGCFASALANVRRCGGVLEHPAESSAWAAHGLARPHSRGWHSAGFCGVHGVELPSLTWGPSQWTCTCENMGLAERIHTPPAFADLLLSIARSAR